MKLQLKDFGSSGIKKKGLVIPVREWLPNRRSQGLVFVEISDSNANGIYVKVLNGEVLVQKAFSTDITGRSEDEAGKLLGGFIGGLRIKSKQCYMVVPSQLFISKNVDVPSSDREEISKIIDLQAGRYTPYSREEIVIDYLCMETPGKHYTNVLLIIANRKVVDRCYRIAQVAGLDIEKFLVSSEGITAVARGMEGVKAESGSVCAICMGGDSTELSISDRHQLVFIRNIPIGVKRFQADSEVAKGEFMKELSASIKTYQDQGVGRPVSTCLLYGFAGQVPSLEDALKNFSGLAGQGSLEVRKVDQRLQFKLSEEVLKFIDTERTQTVFPLLAAAKTLSSLGIDLTPKEAKLKRQVREGSRNILTLGILLMSSILMVTVFLGAKIYLKRLKITRLDEINQATFDQARSLEQASTKSRVLRSLIENRGKGLYVFEKLAILIGEDIYLTSFSYNQDNKLKFSGTADSMSRVFAFVTELEESSYFKDVKTTQTKSRREGQREVADFEIECVFAEAR